MTYLLGGAMPEYPSLRHFFDVIIVAAQKPAFFQERRPLDGARRRRAAARDARRSSAGQSTRAATSTTSSDALGVTGDRILYVGDHIYGDILRSKKEIAWRTAMIIQEMEAEVTPMTHARPTSGATASSMRRAKLEDELRYHQGRYKDLTRKSRPTPRRARTVPALTPSTAERVRTKRGVERVRGLLREVEAESILNVDRIDSRFHPYWGSLLKEASEKSSFGDQVEEYACLYTSRVSNLPLLLPAPILSVARAISCPTSCSLAARARLLSRFGAFVQSFGRA